MSRERERGFVGAISWTILLFLSSACASIRRPPCASENEWGVASASTPQSAQRLSAQISAVAPAVVSRVPGLAMRPVDARFVEVLYVPGVSSEMAVLFNGATIHTPWGTWIELGEEDAAVQERRTLAHELVHYWIGPDWDPLPHFLEEGLADNVKDSVVPMGYASESLNRVLTLSSVLFKGIVFDAEGTATRCLSDWNDIKIGLVGESFWFSFDSRGFQAVDKALAVPHGTLGAVQEPQEYQALVCVGYLLVARIGIERLHRLCLRASSAGHERIPPEWVLEAAGLPAEISEPWNRAILDLFGPVERKERLRRESLLKVEPVRGAPVPPRGS